MDQIKTGKLIAFLRKEKGFTQMMLADRLGISDKTVSKWERGAGLPDVSLMLPLCELPFAHPPGRGDRRAVLKFFTMGVSYSGRI